MHKKESRNNWIIINIIIFISLIFFFRNVVAPSIEPKEVPYSQLIEAIEEQNVAEASIGESKINWKQKDSEQAMVTTRIPGIDESELVAKLRESGAEFSGVISSNLWSTFLVWILPTIIFGLIWFFIIRRMGSGQQQFLSFGKSGAKLYNKGSVKINFSDVAGVDEAIAELKEIVDFLRNPSKYKALGGRIPRGVLLTGPPGTGKTLLSRATAGEAGVPFYSMSGSQFVEMFVGLGAARVRDLFNQAKKNAPCIVFIDEIDTVGRARGGVVMGGLQEQEQTLNQLLTEMDGFDPSKGVIIMAATNRPDMLDPALLRPGRFDRQIVLDKPDMKGREEILKVHAKEVKLIHNINLHTIAARTPGFAGAELANLINEAALLAARQGKQAVEMSDLEEAIDRVMIGLERKSRALSDEEKNTVAHHEMGHALVALLLPHVDPLHRVSVIPRGTAALGMTQQLPLQDRYLYTEEELEDKIAVLLGGRAAEELFCGQVSTGAQNDLYLATQIARHMICDFGMSKKLGPLALSDYGDLFQSGYRNPFQGKQYSEETARDIDEEIHAVVIKNYKRAQALLEANREFLETITKELKERESMDGIELRRKLEEAKAAKLMPPESTDTLF
ncbi:MAG: ATP-dependent zinc metalloprotease FtsH [Dehalococcoidales bacterium]|nr:ATP-dependent zinc metalloprotease FtsH [Dehalococcoidales bacterium]